MEVDVEVEEQILFSDGPLGECSLLRAPEGEVDSPPQSIPGTVLCEAEEVLLFSALPLHSRCLCKLSLPRWPPPCSLHCSWSFPSLALSSPTSSSYSFVPPSICGYSLCPMSLHLSLLVDLVSGFKTLILAMWHPMLCGNRKPVSIVSGSARQERVGNWEQQNDNVRIRTIKTVFKGHKHKNKTKIQCLAPETCSGLI